MSQKVPPKMTKYAKVKIRNSTSHPLVIYVLYLDNVSVWGFFKSAQTFFDNKTLVE